MTTDTYRGVRKPINNEHARTYAHMCVLFVGDFGSIK